MGYYRRGEEPPRKRPRIKPEPEPWICGSWCMGCIYARHITSGYSCAYYEETGLHRDENEPTKACSVRLTKADLAGKKREPKPAGPVRVVGSAGDDLMTYRQIGTVIQKATCVVCNWGKRQKVLGRRVEGFRGVQLTVDEAVTLVKGHEYDLLRYERGLNACQKELLKRLREISNG